MSTVDEAPSVTMGAIGSPVSIGASGSSPVGVGVEVGSGSGVGEVGRGESSGAASGEPCGALVSVETLGGGRGEDVSISGVAVHPVKIKEIPAMMTVMRRIISSSAELF